MSLLIYEIYDYLATLLVETHWLIISIIKYYLEYLQI